MLSAPGSGKPRRERQRCDLATVRDRITRTLTDAFQPRRLEVVDESDLHKGHAGHRPGGESHFRIRIVADAFRGKSRIEMHRAINAALAGEIAAGVHAIAIDAKAD
ncbi:MAG: BolA family transcriptional regulator [Bauldia sp.]|nr:BolA family transcriptional regulator [Bauldia sp.]